VRTFQDSTYKYTTLPEDTWLLYGSLNDMRESYALLVVPLLE